MQNKRLMYSLYSNIYAPCLSLWILVTLNHNSYLLWKGKSLFEFDVIVVVVYSIWYLYASWLNLIFLGWKLKYLIINNCIIFYVYWYWKLKYKVYICFVSLFDSPHHYGITSITVESLCIMVLREGGNIQQKEKIFNKIHIRYLYVLSSSYMTLLSSHLCWFHVYAEAYNNNNNKNIFVECNVEAIFT